MRPILCTCVVLAATCTAAAGASVPTQTPVHPGSARLRGPSGCPSGDLVHLTVTGRRIADVTFYFDNKKVKFLTVPNQPGGRWTLPVRMNRVAFGTHRVETLIDFEPASQTKSRTLRLSFNRCAPAVVPPRLTG